VVDEEISDEHKGNEVDEEMSEDIKGMR